MTGLVQPGFICMIEKGVFMKSFPGGWKVVAGKLSNIDDEFTVLAKDKDFNGRDTCVEIDSKEGLPAARELIMRRLIFLTAECVKPYGLKYNSLQDLSELRHEFAVLVNTGNPEISGQFVRAFELAERYLTEGKNFRITISLSESVKAFYNANYHAHNEHNNLTIVKGCDICLTHGVKTPDCVDAKLSFRGGAIDILYWITCFPCCLLTGIPYMCYKKCIKGVKEENIHQIVPVMLQNGPFQVGYSLNSLLFSPPLN